MSAPANGPNPPPPVRPRTATAAGYLLIIVGAVGLLVWSFLWLLALALAEVLNDPGNGGPGTETGPLAYLALALPVAFHLTETVSGVLVLRRTHWGLVAALIISCLAASVGTGAVALMLALSASSASPATYALLVVYTGVHIRLIYLLAGNDTRRWCSRA